MMGGNDYDCLEDKFYWLRKSKVLYCDYDLLTKDFPDDLQGVNNHFYINEWLRN